MADNRFVTELIVQMAAGNAAVINQFKQGLIDLGVSAKDAAKSSVDLARAAKLVAEAGNSEASELKKVEAAQNTLNKSKAAALNITKEQIALNKQAAGGGGGSLVSALYSDPTTRQIANVQKQIAVAQAQLAKATGDDIVAKQATVDSLTKRYQNFSKVLEEVAGVSKKGFLNEASGSQIAAIINNSDKLNATLGKTGKHLDDVSTKGKFNTNQMLQYTAAFRNTAESLASGMSVSTVAMTQGMQVLGAYMGENIGLMVKLGAVAAITAPAVLTVMRAMSMETQSREVTATSIAYSNMAVSVNDATDSLRRMAETSKFSRDEALAAVKELTKMRNLSPESRRGIMGAAAPFATATGQDLGAATKQLGEAFGGSFEGIRKLDEQFGFLNSTQLETIRVMMKLGDVVGANRIAMDAFAKQMKAAGEAAEGSFALIGRAIASTLNRALDDAARNPVMQWIMRQSSDWARGVNDNGTPAITAENRAAVEAFSPSERAQRYMTRTTGQKVIDQIIAENRAAEIAADRAQKAIDTQNGAYKTQLDIVTKVGVERAKAEAFERYKSQNPLGLSGTKLTNWATSMAAKDPSVAAAVGGLTLQDKGIQRQIDAERELAAAALSGAKAMSIARAEAAYREAEAQGQNKTLAYTASLEKDRSAAMQQLNTELQAARVAEETAARAKQVGLDQATVEMKVKYGLVESTAKYTELLDLQARAQRRLNEENQRSVKVQLDMLSAENDNLSTSERAYQQAKRLADARLAAGTINETQYGIEIDNAAMQRRLSNAQYAADLRKQMNPELVRSNAIADLDASGAAGADRIAKMREIEKTHEQNLIARKELETDWASGAERAWLKYQQSVGTVADQTERVMTDAFKGMEDAMVEFAMTGEMSFEKMANSIIASIVRMQVQSAIGGVGKMFNETGGFSGIFNGLFSAHGNVFGADSNVVPFAKGGVVNGVTPFRFGQGGAMSGIMGEAGPEAIVPLTRTPQGDLGIRSTGGGSQVKVEVIDQRGGNAAPIDVETQMGAFGPIVRIIARDEANRAVAGYAKGGGLTNQLRQDYNLRQPAVNRG